MRLVRAGLMTAAVLAVAQAYVHLRWVDGLSEHCDYPEECVAVWLPFSYGVVTWLWLGTLVAGGAAWWLLARGGASRGTLARVGVGWAAVLLSYPLTPVAQPRTHGIVDIRSGRAPFLDRPYAVAVLLLVAAAAALAWQVAALRRGEPETARRRLTAAPVVLVSLVLLAAATTLGAVRLERSAVATEVQASPEREAGYLGTARRWLDGRPRQVADDVVLGEGMAACTWLAGQPAGDEALQERAAERRYLAAHPEVAGAWPFAQGRTSLRRVLVHQAWSVLCPDVYDDHVTWVHPWGD